MKLDIVFSGIGGQGVAVVSDIFCEAALIEGLDVAKAEIRGIAQRGGSIVAHVRIGDKIQAPLIERGRADIVLGLELLETARAMLMLKDSGTVVVNTKYIPPSTAFDRSAKSLRQAQLLDIIRKKARIVHEIDGGSIANRLGNTLVINIVLLGVLSALPENPVKRESLEKAISSRLEKYLDINLKAFQLGREEVKLGWPH